MEQVFILLYSDKSEVCKRKLPEVSSNKEDPISSVCGRLFGEHSKDGGRESVGVLAES